MNRTDFDAAMAANDVAALIENTFMARVPWLVAGGMTIGQAIIAAKERDDALCLMMLAPAGYWQEEAVKELKQGITERVYTKLRALPEQPAAINPRWVECEAALGHRPSVREFMQWHREQGRQG